MKKFSKSGRGLVVLAVAALASVGIAQAGELNLSAIGNHFPDSGGGTTMSYDMAQYEKLNLSAIGDTIWVARRGAQGPVRADALDGSADAAKAQWAAADRDIQMRLGSVGGRNTN